MSLPQKQNLPSSYTQEWIEYDRLYKLGSQRSQTSNLSFTSASSGMTYTSNTGQEGILQQLQVTLNPYLISSSDYNLIDEHIQEINDIIETHKAEDVIHKTSQQIRGESETPLVLEVISSVGQTPSLGRAILDTLDGKPKFGNGSTWV